jgi:hypothetical protein
MIRTHQLLICADVVNLTGQNINAVKRNAEGLLDDSKEVVPDIKAEKTEYIFHVSSPECSTEL